MCVASFKIILGLTLVLFVVETLMSLLFRRRKKIEILHMDLPGWRSYATFKLLPGGLSKRMAVPRLQGSKGRAQTPLMVQFSQELSQSGVLVKHVKQVGDAERLMLEYGGQRWQMTLGLYQQQPKMWLLTIDEHHGRRGNSAPHDTAEARTLFELVSNALVASDATNIRWHARERWNSGQIDTWSHRPIDR